MSDVMSDQVVNYYFARPFLGPAMMMAIIHCWARKLPPDDVQSFWGFAFKAWTMPYVIAAFHVLMGGDLVGDVMGICVGHAYYCLTDAFPKAYGGRYLVCPQFLYDIYQSNNVASRSMGWQRTAGHRLQ